MEVSSIVKSLNEITSQPASATEADKAQLLGACINLVSTLQPSDQKLMDLIFAPLKPIALRLAIDMRLFDACNPNENVTLEQLSKETKCEALLIKRIMPVLIDMKIFIETDQNVFQPTPAAAIYKYDSPMAQVIIHMTTHMPQMTKLPDYFAEKGYQSPSNSMDCPFQYAMGTKLHNFEYTAANPKLQRAFNTMMTIRTQRSIDSKWFEVFPVERLIKEEPKPEVLLVDIGGGIGHQTIDFKEHHPDVGRMVVQDIAPVINTIKSLPTGIEAMISDFFKPQPVRGARIYFLAHVLHDWPDNQAKVILEHVRDAMTSESVVLLSETIMPERGASFIAAGMDLLMMAAYASLERTEKQFRNLLHDAGLELVNVWTEQKSEKGGSMLGQSILEARLK